MHGIFAPVLLWPLSLSLSAGANLTMYEFKKKKCTNSNVSYYLISILKHNCAWENSRQGETVCEFRRAKIRRGENNPVYNKYVC